MLGRDIIRGDILATRSGRQGQRWLQSVVRAAQRTLRCGRVHQQPSGIGHFGKVHDLILLIGEDADGMPHAAVTDNLLAHVDGLDEIIHHIHGQDRCQDL